MTRRVTFGDMPAEARPSVTTRSNRGRICVVHAADRVGAVPALATDLSAERYDVVPIGLGRSAVAEATAADPDLVIVLVGEDRFDVVRVCATLRDALDCRILVAVEPAHTIDEQIVIDLLDAGADDFVPSTTAASVVLARVRVALRATPLRRRAPQEIIVGDVVIDLEAHAVLVAGEPVNCPPRQFDILVALASNAGTMVLRDTLIADVWRIPPASVDPRRVRIAISVLRSLLGAGRRRPTIESVSRIGYRLVVPPTTT